MLYFIKTKNEKNIQPDMSDFSEAELKIVRKMFGKTDPEMDELQKIESQIVELAINHKNHKKNIREKLYMFLEA